MKIGKIIIKKLIKKLVKNFLQKTKNNKVKKYKYKT